MLTNPPYFSGRARVIGWSLLLAATMAGAIVAACANWHDVFAGHGQIFFVDADCYARMTRVRIVCEHPGRIIAAHDFENYPFGTSPHTTALFDYLIWALRGVLMVFSRGETRDLAGAWISPVLALTAVAAAGVWANAKRLPGRVPMFLVLAASPILAHGFSLGRPDHQSLALACMAWALAAEWALWQDPSRGWGWVSGVAWALGLWTSLYEPGILLAVVLAVGLLFNRPALWRRERLPGLAAGGVILLAALAVEGWRIDALPGFGEGGGASYFAAWSRQIGELASVPPWDGVLFRWTGWGLWIAPVLLLLPRRGSESDDAASGRRLGRAQAVLVVVVWALTCWQMRWGYFLPLVYALSVPWQLGALPGALAAVGRGGPRCRSMADGGGMVGAPASLGRTHRGHAEATRGYRSSCAKRPDFIAPRVRRRRPAGGQRYGAKASWPPWWLSPALAYWSGQPAVAGSSHESLPGTVDADRFYLDRRRARSPLILRATAGCAGSSPTNRTASLRTAAALLRPFARCRRARWDLSSIIARTSHRVLASFLVRTVTSRFTKCCPPLSA